MDGAIKIVWKATRSLHPKIKGKLPAWLVRPIYTRLINSNHDAFVVVSAREISEEVFGRMLKALMRTGGRILNKVRWGQRLSSPANSKSKVGAWIE